MPALAHVVAWVIPPTGCLGCMRRVAASVVGGGVAPTCAYLAQLRRVIHARILHTCLYIPPTPSSTRQRDVTGRRVRAARRPTRARVCVLTFESRRFLAVGPPVTAPSGLRTAASHRAGQQTAATARTPPASRRNLALSTRACVCAPLPPAFPHPAPPQLLGWAPSRWSSVACCRLVSLACRLACLSSRSLARLASLASLACCRLACRLAGLASLARPRCQSTRLLTRPGGSHLLPLSARSAAYRCLPLPVRCQVVCHHLRRRTPASSRRCTIACRAAVSPSSRPCVLRCSSEETTLQTRATTARDIGCGKRRTGGRGKHRSQ